MIEEIRDDAAERMDKALGSLASAFAKIRTGRAHPGILALLKSWLEPRQSVVVLDGCSSAPQPLTNSVYQGTVLGSPLWNVHYADSNKAVQAEGFSEVVFADDLNCSKDMGPTTTETQKPAQPSGDVKRRYTDGVRPTR